MFFFFFCAFQEPAPMTEDLLEEQSEVLAKLGTSAEGTHLRARMQSACLLSDMESFKVRQRKYTHTFNPHISCQAITAGWSYIFFISCCSCGLSLYCSKGRI